MNQFEFYHLILKYSVDGYRESEEVNVIYYFFIGCAEFRICNNNLLHVFLNAQ